MGSDGKITGNCKLLAGAFVLTILLMATGPAWAGMKHNFDCDQCHDPTLSLKALDATTNLCLKCHRGTFPAVPLNPGDIRGASISANTELDAADASDAMGTKTALGLPLGNQTSHNWGSRDNMPAAGALPPTTAVYSTWYNYTRGAVTCSRCHDPHAQVAVATDPTNMTRHADADSMCLNCHRGWDKNDAGNPDAFETHPMVADYAAVVADTGGGGKNEFGKFQAFTPSGEMALVSGGVSCNTCHSVHWADSDSSTADGYGLATPGDGKMLRGDGSTLTGATRNGAAGTAQKRANLCQACHTYELHGKGTVGDHQIGCLECHGGHSYNGGSPSHFVLRADNTDVPTRIDGTNSANASVTFGTYAAGGNSRTKWSDDTNGTAGGYCEQCHGDVQDPANIGAKALEHTEGQAIECTACHLHGGSGWTYSFQVDASAATCGACHGFPPYLSAAGNRDSGGTDGGYAYNDVDPPGTWNYFDDSGYYKDEANTAHNTHAGNNNNPNYYFVGSAGIENCQPCHGPNAGSGSGGHRQVGTAETFRDVPFNAVASAGGNLSPVYNTGPATCDNVYCHTNGTPRTGDATRDYTGVNTTPSWGGGKNAIFTQPNRCNFCHGNDSATMTSKGNSTPHLKHLGAPYNFDCSVCHVGTASSSTALQAGATDGRTGGKHVNSTVDVDFDAAFMGAALSGESYNAGPGTCSVYCHDPSNTANSVDWDLGGPLFCSDCHDGRPGDATTISTGAHTIHLDPAKANIACAECHGANADSGTHSGHVNGTPDVVAGVCDNCHGVENSGPAWDVTPIWTDPASEDCRTCHTGAATTSYTDKDTNPIAAPDKGTALTVGHNKASGTYAATNNSAANKVCEDCHIAITGGHVDGLGNGDRLVGGFSCDDCHTAAGSRQAEATVRVKTHDNTDPGYTLQKRADFTKLCLACHDPHGGSNVTMVYDSQAAQNAEDPDSPAKDFSGDPVFSAFSGADSFDESDGANGDDICATCHTATAHNNASAGGSHNEGSSCLGCHSHDGPVGGFMPTGGTQCNDCHGNPPATGAHALHATVGSHLPAEDRTDCANCHAGADTYGLAPSGTHQNGSTDVLAAGWADGGTPGDYTDDTCTSACHNSTVGDGFWGDGSGLNCNACHGNPPTPSSHDKHIGAGMSCTNCHTGVDTQGPGPLLHNDSDDTSDDGLTLTSRGKDYVNTSGLDAEVDDSAWNGAAGNSFVNGAGATNNTCSNTLCHDPSDSGISADWDTDAVSCTLCHGDATTLTTGSHDNHVNQAAVIGDNIACSACHPDNTALGTDHTLDVSNTQGQVDVGGGKNNAYGGEVVLPNTVYGTCTASDCHQDGKGTDVTSPTWGQIDDPNNCTICHNDGNGNAQPNTADHGDGSTGHWQPARTGLGLSCVSCHANTAASDTTIKAGSLHLNGSNFDVADSGASPQYNGGNVTITYTPGTPSNCTASCHSSNPKNWASPSSCNACHNNPPATGAHTSHATVSLQTTGEDRSDCANCHTGADSYGYTASGNHQNGSVDVAGAGWGDGGTPGDYSDDTCTSACHQSSLADGFWGDGDWLACDACHFWDATPTSGENTAHAKTVSAGHNPHYDKGKYCTDCHGALPADNSHISAADAGTDGGDVQDMAAAVADEAGVTRASMTFNDVPNTCSGGGIGLGCHNSQLTPAWGASITSCTQCHTSGGAAAADPNSGLHAFSTAQRHDNTLLAGNCINCHDSASPSSLHQDGTLHNSGTATFTFNGTNVVSYASGTGCAASCHGDGADWNRQWNGAVDAKPLATDDPASSAVCGNCHGTFSTGWNGPNTNHVNPYAGNDPTDGLSNTANHSVCETCHGWGNANYDADWGAPSANNGHGDGNITLNGPNGTGAGYDNATGGCTAACHAATFVLDTNSGWTANYGDFGAGGACDACHGGTGEFAPDGIAYPDRAGVHAKHVPAIATKMAGGNTAANRNLSCDYCHPNPGEPGHNDNVQPANLKAVGQFKYLIGGALDAGSSYDSASSRCSSIECHGNATWTPHWYGDSTSPGQIIDLAAAPGPEPWSVRLTWTAPGDDAGDDNTAYMYDVRMGIDAGTATNYGLTTNYVGGAPTVDRSGNSQELIVKHLDPAGGPYHFSVRTGDETTIAPSNPAGNWSTGSGAVSSASAADGTVPVFWGVGTATVADKSGSVNLTWDATEDQSMPIIYDIFWSDAGINYGAPQVTGFNGTSYQVDGLTDGNLYDFAVRARDGSGNTETNTYTSSAIPAIPPTVGKTVQSYYAQTAGANTVSMLASGYAGTDNTSNGTVTFYGPNYAVDTVVYPDTFASWIDTGNEATYTATLGIWNGSFNSQGISKNVTLGDRARRVVNFKFTGNSFTVPAGSAVAVRITDPGGEIDWYRWGSTQYRGDLSLEEQILNHVPTVPTLNAVSGSGKVSISWTGATDQDAGHVVHYDVFGSTDAGFTDPFVIATGLAAGTTSVEWDTLSAGLALGAAQTVWVKVEAGDTFDHSSDTTSWSLNNSTDSVAPGQILNLAAEPRPKAGSVYLTWIAPGDDEGNNGAAAEYDIRYSTADITNDSQFNSASPLDAEPRPDFGGTRQGYEVLGLNPGTTYYFAMKTRDEDNNWSILSSSATTSGGPKCGHCHATPPNATTNKGNHAKHGYTINDCENCHGQGVVSTYTGSHQDGQLTLGFKTASPVVGTPSGSGYKYTQGGFDIYDDSDGAGGFNASGGDNTDNGSCGSWDDLGIGGCHGPAPSASWDSAASLSCSNCHGDGARSTDPYGRAFDSGENDQVHASPPLDNHGYDGTGGTEAERKYVGQHEKHLNYSFRYSKGSNCRLCHKDNNHADGVIDINLDTNAVGGSAVFTPNASGPDTAASCGSLSNVRCHDAGAPPTWDSNASFECINCHGFGGSPPSHTTDPGGAGFVDDGKGNCTWCHPAGHPSGALSGYVVIPNNPAVGINYAGGGIHLKSNWAAEGHGTWTTEAETCWGCHDDNSISEWGADDGPANDTSVTNGGANNYNFGSVTSSNWTSATWTSATGAFGYKTAAIQSTHTTNAIGSSAVSGTDFNYSESVDAAALIRCSNCHDVHNRNLADNDTMSGAPFLRGSWKNNPYPEDGAPQSGTTYTAYVDADSGKGYGQIPRGGSQYNQTGGYQIDQNNGYPTAGWTLSSSAGLCVLCHGSNVDNLDQTASENLWVGTNGHSNAAIGSTGSNAADILNFAQRNPAATPQDYLDDGEWADRPSMGYQNAVPGSNFWGMGWRSTEGEGWGVTPTVHDPGRPYAYNAFQWGVTQNNGTIDIGYHAFSCSKCHNPHASRLPKLMITNCLDTGKNSWDDSINIGNGSNGDGMNPSLDNRNKTLSQATSAQNCHRYGDQSQSGTGGGWNKVTPW